MVHFVPNFIAILRQSFAHHAAAPVRPQAQLPRPAQVVPPPPPDPDAVALFQATTEFAGIWAGRALDSDQNMCQIRLEVRPAIDKPGFFSGYESRSCIPALPLKGGAIGPKDIPTIIKDASPVSATMIGSVISGDLVFRVDRPWESVQAPASSRATQPLPSAQDSLWPNGSKEAARMATCSSPE